VWAPPMLRSNRLDDESASPTHTPTPTPTPTLNSTPKMIYQKD